MTQVLVKKVSIKLRFSLQSYVLRGVATAIMTLGALAWAIFLDIESPVALQGPAIYSAKNDLGLCPNPH